MKNELPILPKPLIKSDNPFPVVGIGASAGGLEAFKKLIEAIPENSGMAYVLVQHLDPNHDSLLVDLLQKVTSIPVLEISDDIKVESDHIYIIPSNKMLIANDGVLELSPRPVKSKGDKNLPIDLFFTSLADVHQSHSIGVVLSGTASDGTIGLKAIKDHGGLTFAQDHESAAFGGMPNSAVQAGVVDFIMPPDQIPLKILEINKSLISNGAEGQIPPLQDEEVFKQILSLLRIRKGTDFSYYKQTTIRRRILRRMALNKKEALLSYIQFLRETKSEQDALYQDLLIPVTSFFRDPKTFDHLYDPFAHIINSKSIGGSIRVWVAGCSTGEEAYSMAMCFTECLGTSQRKIQVFATDISEPAIAKARSGIYTKSELAGVSPSRLKEFFTKSNDVYQVKNQLRDMCVFAIHNFLKDPPFGKMDLISCRNVLIYMEPYLQKKALTTFHYALNPKGYVLLGRTESANSVHDLFELTKKSEKLFTRNDVPIKYMHTVSPRSEIDKSNPGNFKIEALRNDFQKTADDIILSKYTPAGVIVNEAMEIVNFRGNTASFLEQLPGKPSHNLIKMARHGLGFELRNLVHRTKKEKTLVSKEDIHIRLDGTSSILSIDVIPLPKTIEPYYLVLFRHTPSPKSRTLENATQKQRGNQKLTKEKNIIDERDLRIQQLEHELAQSHEDMRSITDDQEAANEELQSDNEELLSSSEELQSLNEELETSKEELQSTNEELLVVNQEMISLNEQLTSARNYAEAIVSTTREPLIVLDEQLRIKTANKSFYDIFRMRPFETEGKLIYDLDDKQWNIPSLRNLLEQILPGKESFSDFELVHNFHHIGLRTVLLNAREMKGERIEEKLILLALEDITDLSSANKKMQIQADMVRDLFLTAPAFICTLRGPNHVYELVNERYQQLFGKRKIIGRPIMEALPELAGQGFDTLLDKVYNSGETYVGIDIPMILARDENQVPELCFFNFSYQAMRDENKSIFSILVFGYEVTEQVVAKNKILELQHLHSKELEGKVEKRTAELHLVNEILERKNEELEIMNTELNSFTYVSSHDLQEPLRKIQTFSNLILESEAQHLSDTGKDYFSRIQSASARMQRLIEDLLAFSRLNTAERTFENTDLNQIVKQVESELRETIIEKKAVIEITELCEAYIIPFQFRQLLHNIIGNALKFSKPDVPPHIVIGSSNIICSKKNDTKLIPGKEYCRITIQDNGIGFEPHFSKRIFEIFQQLHGKDKYAGTGIGLAIVKKIVENHSGTITAISEINEGVTFEIYIPVDPR